MRLSELCSPPLLPSSHSIAGAESLLRTQARRCRMVATSPDASRYDGQDQDTGAADKHGDIWRDLVMLPIGSGKSAVAWSPGAPCRVGPPGPQPGASAAGRGGAQRSRLGWRCRLSATQGQEQAHAPVPAPCPRTPQGAPQETGGRAAEGRRRLDRSRSGLHHAAWAIGPRRKRNAGPGRSSGAGPGPGASWCGAARAVERLDNVCETIVVTLNRSCSWCPATVLPGTRGNGPRQNPGRAEASVPPASAAAFRWPGTRPGPGKRPPGRVPGTYSRVSG